jgi:hypothetical protein
MSTGGEGRGGADITKCANSGTGTPRNAPALGIRLARRAVLFCLPLPDPYSPSLPEELGSFVPTPVRFMSARVFASCHELAAELGLSCFGEKAPLPGDLRLFFADHGAGLKALSMQVVDGSMGPLCIDYGQGALAWKRDNGRLAQSPLVRACTLGQRPVARTHIVDGTGGLGADAYMLASRGFRVTLVERHPVLWALLRDGLQRAQRVPAAAAVCANMTLHRADVKTYLAQLGKFGWVPGVSGDDMYVRAHGSHSRFPSMWVW